MTQLYDELLTERGWPARQYDASIMEPVLVRYPVRITEKNNALAEAAKEGIELTEKHWDVIHYLRDEYINNNGNQPMERVVLKDMGNKWGSKPTSKDLYQLFPQAPTKQGTKIAGLPQVMRKGGY